MRRDVILKNFQKEGIWHVQLYNRESFKCKLHRLLAQAFKPNPDNKKYVVFLDGNPENLKLENIGWATKSECFKLSQSLKSWSEVFDILEEADFDTNDPNLLRNLNQQFELSPIK